MLVGSLYGRLGREPEVRATRNGSSMTIGSIAVDVTGYGAEKEQTEWVSLIAFGQAGESLAQHQTGDVLAAIGKLTRKPWTDRNGNERTSWSMTVDALHSPRTVRPGSGRHKSTQTDPGVGRPDDSRDPPGAAGDGAPFDDEIPF